MKYNSFLLVICLAAFSCTLLGQTILPQQTSVFRPKLLMEKVLKERDLQSFVQSSTWGQKTQVSEKKFWIVFSDRSNNMTYQKPDASSAKYKSLSFNEEVRIAQITNDFALIYKDPKTQYPYISSEAECMGWIPMKNLLLWTSCPANDRGIYNKALLVVNLDYANATDKTYNSYYYTPYDSDRAYINQPGMEFFFIMKEENDMVLLSHQHTLEEGATTQTLYGWVSKHAYIAWNQRSCLEPNWDTDEVPRLTSVSVKAKNGLTNTYRFGQIWTKDNSDEDRYRIPAAIFRYPILDNDNYDNTIYKCTTFGNGGNAGGQDLGEVIKTWQTALEKQESVLKKMQNLNLIVVIDGTKSMDPYFASVKEAIVKGCEYFGSNYTPRVGIVIYRDYKSSMGLIETLKMTNAKDQSWKSFLDEGAEKCKQDVDSLMDMEEALYVGLNTALDTKLMGYKSDESNLILVVGDCGNHLNDKDERCPTEAELIKKMTDNRIHLMSFQVRRNNAQPWILFNRQMSKMLKNSIQARYDALGLGTKIKFAEVSNGYDLKREDGEEQMFFVGATRYAMEGTEMAPVELTNLMAKNFRIFGEAVQAQIDLVAQFRNGRPVTEDQEQRTATEKMNEAILKQLLGETTYNDIVKKNKMLAFTGYTPKVSSSGIEYWKPVLFISRSELQSLLDRLSDVDESAKTGDRLPLINAIKALVRSMLPGVSDKEMDQKGLGEVMALIAGLNAATKTMTSNRSLADLGDPRVVSAAEFNTIVTDFQRKYKNLRNIINDKNYRFICRVNQVMYYWIPVDELP